MGRRPGLPGFPDLRDKPWSPVTQPLLAARRGRGAPTCLAAMREGDILLHHPLRLVLDAVERSSRRRPPIPSPRDQADALPHERDSPLVRRCSAPPSGQAGGLPRRDQGALRRARTSTWARALEQSGVHVVYGHPGAQDARQAPPGRPPRGRRRAPRRAPLNWQLPPDDRAPPHGFRAADVLRPDLRRRRRVFNQLTGFARPREKACVLVAPDAHARRSSRTSSARIAEPQRGRAPVAHV